MAKHPFDQDNEELERFLREKVGDRDDAPPLPELPAEKPSDPPPSDPATGLTPEGGPVEPEKLEAFLNEKVGDRDDAPPIDGARSLFTHDPASKSAQDAESARVAQAEQEPSAPQDLASLDTDLLEETRLIRSLLERAVLILEQWNSG